VGRRKIAGCRRDAIAQTGGGDVSPGDWFDGWKIEGNTVETRMLLRRFDAEQLGRAADVKGGLWGVGVFCVRTDAFALSIAGNYCRHCTSSVTAVTPLRLLGTKRLAQMIASLVVLGGFVFLVFFR
jgi:hypothetical protein